MPSNDKTEKPSPSSTPRSSFAASLLALKEIAGYSVEAVLGSGTYGVVLRASHAASGGTPCALKVFKTPLVRTESASLDSAWASLSTEARALELLGATAAATATTKTSTAALASSSSSSASASLSSSAPPSGIPRLFEYGILKANSRSKGPGGAAEEGGEGNSSVDATHGGDSEQQQEGEAGAEAEAGADKRKSPSPAAPTASPPPLSENNNKDPSPDAVCYAWMATELLGPDLWRLMRDTKQRAKARAASSWSSTAAAASGGASSKDEAQRRACKLACRALLAELATAMLSALEQVHARGLVHRDVKLDNFAAAAAAASGGGKGGEKNTTPSAYLLDFGGVTAAPSLAAGSKAVDAASKGKKTCFFGTPEYCSSAAFTGELPPTPAQDVEALGYCLLELWGGGRLPWGEAFRARRETANERWSSANLREMRLARDADWERAVRSGAVPWWLDSWITHAKQQQEVFASALAAAVAARATSGGGGGASAAEGAAAAPSSASPPAAAAAAAAPGGGAAAVGMPNYRMLRSLLKAAAAQASAEAEVAEEAAAKGRVVAERPGLAQRAVEMEE